jgi:pimeloyl-ACP methyl ester carboxylesterase
VPRTRANGIDIEYEVDGPVDGESLLLIMGLSAQLTWWEPTFPPALVAKGFRVIRFDNRDVGLSTWLDDLGTPDFTAPPYGLDDMAEDAVELLTALGVQRAHIVGASMGGMIAQQLAISHPDRVLSLTSIMSHVGGDDVVYGDAETMSAMSDWGDSTLESQLEAWLRGRRFNMGPNESWDDERERSRAMAELTRGNHPAGAMRQLAAVIAAPSRRSALAGLRMPALVIHGEDDPLIPPENGHRTAAASPGARLLMVERMGHDIPPDAVEAIASAIAQMAQPVA